MNVGVFEPESGIDVRSNFAVGFDDVFDVGINKVVERVDVLFDETFHSEESRQQEPFILLGLGVKVRAGVGFATGAPRRF